MPYASLIMDKAGNLYGTTYQGGTQNFGTVFTISPDGTEKVLHSFTGDDGAIPYSDLIMDGAGNLYGTTAQGGESNKGLIYKITPDGTETIVHEFAKDGKGVEPLGRVTFSKNGSLIGTTFGGGKGDCMLNDVHGCGTVYEISPGGKEKVFHKFAGGAHDGEHPYGGVVIDTAGNIYGTTLSGGIVNKHCLEPSPGCGTIFKLAPDGTETVLHYFAGKDDSACPVASMIADSSGNLFGTTIGCGSTPIAFKVTPDGTETILHAFSGKQEGPPAGGLIADASGNLYGATIDGANGSAFGTIFQLAPDGTETVLHTFSAKDGGGWVPVGGLVSDENGNLYGTTSQGGAGGRGTVFELEK